ncbi:hypothetical protein JCM10449v2_000129 [Rhodotorula kratochvilovae]
MANRRLSYGSSTDSADDGRTSGSDSDDTAPPRRRAKQALPPQGTLSPVLIGTIAVLVLCVAVLLVVIFRQRMSSSDASTGSAGASASAGTATTRHSTAAATTGGGGDAEEPRGGGPSKTKPAASASATGGGGGHDEDEDEDADSPKPTRSNSAPSASSTAPSSGGGNSGSLPPLAGEQLLIDFSTFSSSSGTVEAFLNAAGLTVSDWQVDFTPIPAVMSPANVDIVDGALQLKVTGQSGTGPVQSAEVVAAEENILYGKVTTRAKASPTKGVCHGFFFYHQDHREVDIELLTSYYTEGRGDSVKPGIQYTNHPLTEDGEMYNEVYAYPWDPTADFHDYTVEWTAEETIFSLDGEVIATFTVNVPQKPMTFNWNSWSSGEPNWSAGPPTEDSYLLISGIAANWTT